MATIDIVITEFLEPKALDALKAEFNVHFDPELWNKRGALEALVKGVPGLIVRNRTPVDQALLDIAAKLRVVGRLGVGLDNIDVAYCDKKGVEVISARGANATSVSEYVIAMAMTLLRGPAYLGTGRLIAGEWPRESFGRGFELAGKRLGIIGLGSIGATTARKARALDMRVIANDPYLPDGNENWHLAERSPLDALLASSDVVAVHCPLTTKTRGMIGPAELARMKKDAVLVNSARGGIIDHTALAVALRTGRLAGAAIDVFVDEPIRKEEGAIFAGVPNIILTPHISGVTSEANTRVSFMTADGVARILRKGR